MNKTLYKILVNGKSCHGGDFEWSLPQDKKPGDWHKYESELEICRSGFHLTTKPFEWYVRGCECYLAEAKGIKDWEDDKCVASEVRLLKKVPHPKWWTDTLEWIETLKAIAWLKPDGKPNPEWKLFPNRDAARDAAWDVAWDAACDAACDAARDAARKAARKAARDAACDAAKNAAWDAAWEAAWNAARNAARDAACDAALYARCSIISDLKLSKKHRDHAKARMEVWQKGYGLYCDINGVLYVYEQL